MALKFENLRMWQMAIDLSAEIDTLTLTFPKREDFVLSPQIRRAADSTALNIAEGSTGQSNAEFNRFLGIALRSAIEVISCLYLGQKRKILNNDDFKIYYDKTVDIIKSIQALRNKLKQ